MDTEGEAEKAGSAQP